MLMSMEMAAEVCVCVCVCVIVHAGVQIRIGYPNGNHSFQINLLNKSWISQL